MKDEEDTRMPCGRYGMMARRQRHVERLTCVDGTPQSDTDRDDLQVSPRARLSSEGIKDTYSHEDHTPSTPIRSRHRPIALNDVEPPVLHRQVKQDTQDRSSDSDDQVEELVSASGSLVI